MVSTPPFACSPTTTMSLDGIPVTWLVTELLQTIFDSCSAAQLLTISWVCSSWRATARAHANYWSTPDLLTTSDGALSWFFERIDAVHGPLRSVFLVPEGELADACANAVLDALERNIHRILELDFDPIAFGNASSDRLARVLCQRAPLLETFTYYGRGAAKIVHLPDQLFADHAPRLRNLALLDTTPSRIPLSICANVESVKFVLRTKVWHDENTFAYPHTDFFILFLDYPRLRSMDVSFYMAISMNLPARPALNIGRFGSCCVNIESQENVMEFLSWPPCRLLPRLQLPAIASDVVMSAALRHLVPGPIGLAFTWLTTRADGVFSLRAANLDDGRERTFARCMKGQLQSGSYHLSDAHVVDAVTALRVPLDLFQTATWWLAGRVFPSVTELTLEVDRTEYSFDELFEGLEMNPAPVPGLVTLTLAAQMLDIVLDAAIVHQLVHAVLKPQSAYFRIVLQGVTIQGDSSALPITSGPAQVEQNDYHFSTVSAFSGWGSDHKTEPQFYSSSEGWLG